MNKLTFFLQLPYVDKKMMLRKIFLMPLVKRYYGYIGKGSCIEKELAIRGKKDIFIGENTFIRPGARIECVNNHLGKEYSPRITIGDHVNIEQNLHMTCAERITIENNVAILSDVLITDINHSYSKLNIHPLEQQLETSPVHIGEFSLIGSGSRILPGVHIGKNVVVGANAVVTKDIPDYSVAVGAPAVVIKKYDFTEKKWKKV